MKRSRDELLSRSALTLDEDRPIARRRLLDQSKDGTHCRGLADDFRIRLASLKHRFELAIFFFEPRSFPSLFDQNLEFRQGKRLGQVIGGAQLHRFDRRIDRPLRRQ